MLIIIFEKQSIAQEIKAIKDRTLVAIVLLIQECLDYLYQEHARYRLGSGDL